MVLKNLTNIREKIKHAAERAGRSPEAIKLIVVTKEADLSQVREVVASGVIDVGENRVKAACLKKEVLDHHVLVWHMIGHLQTKKAKKAVDAFSLIHSIDNIKLLCAIDKCARDRNKVQDVLIEVNVSGEKSKFGVSPEALTAILEESKHLRHTKVLGLMTMAPFTNNAEDTRSYFKKLKVLADKHGLKELSMGMSQDFEVAIEEGATMVRIGSAIFK